VLSWGGLPGGGILNHPDFTLLRRQVDEAITFNDLKAARDRSIDGLCLAEQKECPGEKMYFLAQLAILDEHYPEAILLLERALIFNQTDGAAYNDIALCRVELKQADGILETFDQGIAVEPDYATIHHNKGWFLNQLGRHQEALPCFERALELEPDRAVTYENLADAYEKLGRFDDAMEAYKKALELIRDSSRQIKQQIQDEIVRLDKEHFKGDYCA
jgi:tetratricopeptide (TPR) repeat protein